MLRYLDKFSIAYHIIPYKRNQDVVRIVRNQGGWDLVISVVDGYSNPKYFKGNQEGREVAHLVSKLFPELFYKHAEKDLVRRAKKVAQMIDKHVLAIYPERVACVGIFLFQKGEKQIIVTVGSVIVYLWNGKEWYKPKEIGDYSLDPKKPESYGSDVSRFFGGGDNKDKPVFSCEPDIVETSSYTPVFLATDGLEDIFDLNRLNNLTYRIIDKRANYFIKKVSLEIIRSKKQIDDISILLKGNLQNE